MAQFLSFLFRAEDASTVPAPAASCGGLHLRLRGAGGGARDRHGESSASRLTDGSCGPQIDQPNLFI